MRRFFCSVCNRPRRVKVMPSSVRRPDSEKVADRIGVCRWHDGSVPRHPVMLGKPTVRKTKSTPQPAANANAKSKGTRSGNQQ